MAMCRQLKMAPFAACATFPCTRKTAVLNMHDSVRRTSDASGDLSEMKCKINMLLF